MPGMTSSGHWIRQGPHGADAAETDGNTPWARNGGRPAQQQRNGWPHAEDGSFKPIPYPVSPATAQSPCSFMDREENPADAPVKSAAPIQTGEPEAAYKRGGDMCDCASVM